MLDDAKVQNLKPSLRQSKKKKTFVDILRLAFSGKGMIGLRANENPYEKIFCFPRT